MTTKRNNQPEPQVSQPEPQASQPEPQTLLSLADLQALAAAAKAQASKSSSGKHGIVRSVGEPCSWGEDVTSLAKDLGVTLPTHYPAKAPNGVNLASPAFVSAPKDLATLNDPIPGPFEIKDFKGRRAILHALSNDFHGAKLYPGESATNGGKCPLSVIFMLLMLEKGGKSFKWLQRLTNNENNQICIMAAIANVSNRNVILRDGLVTLTTDFYGEAAV